MAIRCSVLFAALLVPLVGCGKSAPSSTADTPGEPKGGTGDAHTIKIREKHAGEKYDVTQTVTRSEMRFQGNGKDKEPAASVEKVTTKSAYVEEVERVDGAAVLKGKRAYTTAEGADFGKVVPLSFAGQTVTHESTGGKVTFALADGKPVPPGADTFALQRDFDRNRPKGIAQLVPDTAVKVGETWDVPADKMSAVFGPAAQAGAMKATGTLEKAYTKGGKGYGVLSIRLEATLNEKGGKDALEWTYDGCIDGTVTDGTRKLVQTIRVPPGPKGGTVPDLVNTTEITITPAK